MADWGPVVIALVFFVMLSPGPLVLAVVLLVKRPPGLCFQLPGSSRAVEFGNFQTIGVFILVHTIITIFLIAIGVYITSG